jgi:transcription elongation GreA/GreB family factor
MREELEKLVAAGKITRHHVDPLLRLVECGFCMHRSWGFGKLAGVDTVFARFSIDFPGKPAHSMDLAFAAESLKPIAPDHILARKASDLAGLRQMAALQHLELIKLVVNSYGGQATLEQIQQVLVPDVIAADWRKWWEVARHELKKSGHFIVPSRKSEPLIYQAKEVSLQDRLMGEFRAAKGLKARVAVAQELLKNLADLSDPKLVVEEAVVMLNTEIASHQRTLPALALEAVFARDELRHIVGLAQPEGELTADTVWSQTNRVGAVLEQMSAAKHRQGLLSFKAAFPETWVATVTEMLNQVSARLCGEAASLLIQSGHWEHLKDALARLISQHQASSELLLWLAKERSDAFADILGPEVFRAMLTAMERDQFNEKKSNRLRDFILDDQSLLVELIGSADLEVIKDLTRTLQLSPCFDDMDKRSLLARIVKSYPAIQSLITGEQAKQDNVLIVSWESLERRRQEYDDLVHKKIPANSKEIAIARSYGDLRENHEYKAAKEMQKILMRRKVELESQLLRARGADFANPKTDGVNLGTTVRVTDVQSQQSEQFTILGAWDLDLEQGIISYLSPIAQALLGRKVGDEVEFEFHGAIHRYRVDAVEAVRVPADAPPVAAPFHEAVATVAT